MTSPSVPEWELDNAWRRLIDEYETKQELSPSVLAQGLILHSEAQGVVKESLDDYEPDEFVVLVFQLHMVRPDPQLQAAAEALLRMLGPDGLSGEAEPDLEAMVAALHQAGGPVALREQSQIS